MVAISFSDWDLALTGSNLKESAKQAYRITQRWYLAYCRDNGCKVDFESARSFVREASVERPNVPAWAIEQWKSVSELVFRNARSFNEHAYSNGSTTSGAQQFGDNSDLFACFASM